MNIDEPEVIDILDDDEETTFAYLHMVTITMEELNEPTGLAFISIYRKLVEDFEKHDSWQVKKSVFKAIKLGIRQDRFIKVFDQYAIKSAFKNCQRIATEIVRFRIHQNPKAQQRHRYKMVKKRYATYNPSSQAQALFGSAVKDKLSGAELPIFNNSNALIHLKLIFRLKRPASHFETRKAVRGQLKQNAPKGFVHGKPDVDNLAKFCLDAMNGILFKDDSQVVFLETMKIYDTKIENSGSTEVIAKRIHDHEFVSS